MSHDRRPHHLPREAYEVEGSVWHVTLCTHEQADSPFSDNATGLHILKTLDTGIRFRRAIPHVICVMPDHVHALIEVGALNLFDVLARTKSESNQSWWRCGGSGKLWQKDFYDRGVRESDDFVEIATYILNNPVRAELVDRWDDYPLICGTFLESA